MDRVEHYRSVVRRIVADYLEYLPNEEGVEHVAICDDHTGNYLMLAAGWKPPKHLVDVLFYLRIKDNKIWVELDWTKRGVVPDLLNAGILPNEIELGFQPPEMRPYTELAEMAAARKTLREGEAESGEHSPMQQIRDAFQRRLDELLLLAKGFIFIAGAGQIATQDLLSRNPDADAGIAFGRNVSSATIYPPFKLADAIKEYREHAHAIEEMILEQFVQSWQEFLDQVFEQMLNEHFGGSHLYPEIGKMQIDLDMATDTPAYLAANVQQRALQRFGLSKPAEKLRIIEKALKIDLDQEQKQILGKHIVIRNILQHNNGILRQTDLAKVGVRKIELLDKSNKPQEYSVDDRVEVSIWELSRAKHNLADIASKLIS